MAIFQRRRWFNRTLKFLLLVIVVAAFNLLIPATYLPTYDVVRVISNAEMKSADLPSRIGEEVVENALTVNSSRRVTSNAEMKSADLPSRIGEEVVGNASTVNSSRRVTSNAEMKSADLPSRIGEEVVGNASTVNSSGRTNSNLYPMDPAVILSNPAICKDSPDLNWIVYVHTSCNNSEKRELLRKTWANPLLFKDLSFKVVFMMGRASEDDVQEDVKEEFDKYGDIIQGDFVDEYKNLTVKAVMSLKWISTYCPHVPYVMKTDDDTFLNIFEIVRLARENRHKSSVIMCPLWKNNTMPILRDRKTCRKWCVKRSEFPGLSFFPQYCAGIAYVISRQLVKQLYEASKSTPFFWIDDVYVTGLLTKRVPDRINYVNISDRMTLYEDEAVVSYKNQTQPIAYDIVHVHDRLIFITLWNTLLDRLTDSQKISLRQNISTYIVQNISTYIVQNISTYIVQNISTYIVP